MPRKINAPIQNAPRIPSNQSIIPEERDDGCKNLSPMSPFRVKLTDPCAEGTIDKGIFRSTKLTT